MDPNAITQQFTTHYYQQFGSGQRANMRGLYQADSCLCFEGQQHMGPDAIIGKLTTLAFTQVAVQVISKDWLCLLYTSPSPRDQRGSRMPSSA